MTDDLMRHNLATQNSTTSKVTHASVAQLIQQSAQRFPHHVALQLEEHGVLNSFEYIDLQRAVEQASLRLQTLGVQPGVRLALLSENRPEWVIAYLAILTCQATAVVLDTNLEVEDYQQLLQDAQPAAVLVTDKLQAKIPFIHHIPLIAIQHQFEIINSVPAITLPLDADSDPQIATMLYTSGTTGRFKGVMLTQENLLFAIESARQLTKANEQESILCILPGYHVFGLVCALLTPLAIGAKITFVEKMQGEVIVKAMRDSGCTVLLAVPRLLELFAAGIDRQVMAKSNTTQVLFKILYGVARYSKAWFNLNLGKHFFKTVQASFGGKLRLIVSGGASLDKAIFYQLQTLGFTILEGYGLTETTSLATANTLNKQYAGKVGVPIGDVKVELFNTNAHGEGEIIVQGKGVMRGYFRDPQASEIALRDNWLHTGDLGKFDHHGNLTITGRIKELIVKPNGEKAMPSDVEQRYRQIPGVAELAVIGMPAKSGYGEEIHAAIVLTGQDNVMQRQDDVKHFIVERSAEVPATLRIQECHFVTELPKTSTLKVKRKVLVQQLLAEKTPQETNKVAPELNRVDDHITAEVNAVITEIMAMTSARPVSVIKPDYSIQFDLGLDSLSRLELAEAIQKRFNIHFPEEQLAILYTVKDLTQAVKRAKEMPAGIVSPMSVNQVSQTATPHKVQSNFLPPEPRSELNQRIQQLMFSALKKLLVMYFGIETQGQERLPHGRPFIIAANHTSHLDSACIAAADGVCAEKLVFMAAKDYHFGKPTLRSKILKYFFNLVPFERNLETVGILQNIETCRYYVQQGCSLVIFPEATRSINGKLQNFKAAVPIIAAALNIPIVPAYISGAYACLPKGKVIPKPGKIRITFGDPLYIEHYQVPGQQLQQQQHQLYKNILHELKQRIEKMAIASGRY